MPPPNKLFLLTKIFGVFLLALFVFYGCKKMDIDSPTTRSQEKIERFFKLPMNASQVLKRIVEDLREKDANAPFVEKFIEQQGYPIWEKAEIRLPLTQKGINKEQANQATGTDTIIVIPTVLLNEEFVKSLFCAKMDVNILYKLIEGERYAEFGFDHDPNRAEPNADDIVAQFIKFEQINFNDTLFLIKDNRLFDNWPVGTIKPVSFLLRIKTQHTTNNDFPTNGESCTLYYDVGAGYWLFGQCNLGGGGSGGQTGNGNGNVGTIGWNPMPTGGGNGTPTGTPPPPISLCDRGWVRYVAISCPTTFPAPPISPINDSIPNILSRARNDQADSVFNWGLQNNNREQSFILVKKDGIIYPKNFQTGTLNGDKTRVNYTLGPDEQLVAYIHTHPSPTPLERSSFSSDDFIELTKNRNMLGYTAILECGNVRYALVIEDLAKLNTFTSTRRNNVLRQGWDEAIYGQPNIYSNGPQACVDGIIQYLGSSAICGIGFYRATAPNKTNFIKLNP